MSLLRSISDTCETPLSVPGTDCTSTFRRFPGSWKLLNLARACFGLTKEHDVERLQSGRSGARLPAVIPRLASMFDQIATWLVASTAKLVLVLDAVSDSVSRWERAYTQELCAFQRMQEWDPDDDCGTCTVNG
jgi:hypothetical protein